MTLQATKLPRKHRRWLDGVEPKDPVPHFTIGPGTSDRRTATDSTEREQVSPRPALFPESAPSVEGVKAPGWMLPLLGVVAAILVILPLNAYYHWW